ncbi:MAG: hypothetical protein BGP10_13170 [Rhodanobacter sp. 68-29]|nr:MAG: hypothetical protein ABT18_12995 [Rhodanobacter sp. SCN 66-43]OJY58275.1 MAG: hypothetical protein BGP10_13170 [Rhodanobacter sp. 68-29]
MNGQEMSEDRVRIALKAAYLAQLDFDRQVIGVDPKGRLKTRATPVGTRDWWLGDAEVRGLWIRVSPGAFTWHVRRKLAGNTRARAMAPVLRPGAPGGALDLAQARKQAHIWLGVMARGEDPLLLVAEAERSTQRQHIENSETLGKAYLAFCETDNVKPATQVDRRKVVGWMSPAPIWSVPWQRVGLADVERSLGPLLEWTRTGKRPSGLRWGPSRISPGTLSKIFAYLSAAWTRSARHAGMLTGRGQGPFALWRADKKWPGQVSRTTMLDTKSQAGLDWLRALAELRERAHAPDVLANRPDPRSREVKPHLSVGADFYVLVLLWGTRLTETALMRWEAVRWDEGYVQLAPETTKSGKAGVVPLTRWASEILQQRQEVNARWRPDDPGEWVFPSRQHGKPMSNPRGILAQINAAAGLSITTHDLRRTLASEMPVDLAKAGQLLLSGAAMHHSGRGGSTIGGATAGYVQRQAQLLAPLYQEREDRLRTLMGLDPPEPTSVAKRRGPKRGDEDHELIARIAGDPELLQRIVAKALAKK